MIFLGLGAGFPVLKKTQRAVRDENTQETVSQVLLRVFKYLFFPLKLRYIYKCIIKMTELPQEPETKPEEKNDAPPQEEEEAPKKPKWMPPKHPG